MIEEIIIFIGNHWTGVGALLLVGFLSMIEIAPIKINPWSKIFGTLGKMLNKELYDKIEKLEEEQIKTKTSINERLDEMGKQADEKESRRLRASIISFADSCRNNQKHSRVQYENIFRDYNEYVTICEKHDLKNHYIDEEMKYVEAIFHQCSKENNFI